MIGLTAERELALDDWFHPLIIMLYTANMPARPVQISIDTALLRKIDADPEVRQKGRSAFIREAVELYFTARERRELEAGLAAAYSGEADAMLDEVAELIRTQEWPES
jgi:metal-responsive CopG/Arc/MetJ family transcriptional regulator